MEVLFLDDDSRAIVAFENTVRSLLGERVYFTSVSNLVDFDYELYESGKTYDRYVIDLGLNKPTDFPEEAYAYWLKEHDIFEITLLDHVIPVPGWDYFEHVMKKRDSTKDRLARIMLKTGFADLLVKEKGEDCYKPAKLLNKGAEDYINELKDFFIG